MTNRLANRLRASGPRLALLVAAAGLVACSSSDSAAVVSSSGNSTATSAITAVTPTTVAVTDAPTTAAPTTIAEATTAEATTTTVAPNTAAPTTAAAPTTTPGAPVPGPNVYLAFTDTGNVTARSGDQVLGEASCGECSVSAATYRDGTIWMAAFSDVAEVTRHDLSTGSTTSVYRADPGVTIRDLAVWDSSVWIVTSNDKGESALLAVDAGGARSIDGGVVGVQASQDGRYLAYSTCGVCASSGPRNFAGSVIVVADLVSGVKRDVPSGENGRYFIAPVPKGWTSAGQLLIDETWEGNSTAVLDALTAATQADSVHLTKEPSAPGQPYASAEAACFVDAEHVAVARWTHPYAEGDPEPGPIVVRTLTSPVETTYGAASVIGTSMACDTGGAVVVATDDGRLVRIAPDGTTTELGVGYALVSAA